MKNLAIVGIGRWGKNLVREFSKMSNIVMCHSNGDKDNLIWLQKNFPTIKHTKNFQDILDNKSINAIVIASPIKTHFSIAYQVIQADKHLFIEKTVSENSSDAKKLISMAKKRKVVLFAGHIFLYHPVLKRIKKITKNESISYLKFSWTKTGSFQENILLDLVSHFVSIIVELVGIPRSIKIIDIRKVVYSYDIVTIEFGFKGQHKCIVDINRISNFKKRSITIMTTKNIFEWDDDILYKFNKRKLSYEPIFVPNKTSLEIECKAFIQSLNSKLNYSNANRALKIIQLVEKCKEMIKK